MFCELRQEDEDIVNQPKECTHIFATVRGGPVKNSVDLIIVGFNTACGDLVAQKVKFNNKKFTFLNVAE